MRTRWPSVSFTPFDHLTRGCDALLRYNHHSHRVQGGVEVSPYVFRVRLTCPKTYVWQNTKGGSHHRKTISRGVGTGSETRLIERSGKTQDKQKPKVQSTSVF